MSASSRKHHFRGRVLPCTVAECNRLFSNHSGLSRHISTTHSSRLPLRSGLRPHTSPLDDPPLDDLPTDIQDDESQASKSGATPELTNITSGHALASEAALSNRPFTVYHPDLNGEL